MKVQIKRTLAPYTTDSLKRKPPPFSWNFTYFYTINENENMSLKRTTQSNKKITYNTILLSSHKAYKRYDVQW